MDNLTIVVPYYNQPEALNRLLASLPADLPVIVVDDKSDVAPRVDRKNTRVVRIPRKGYFTGAVNYGISLCQTDVLILNQDVTLTGDRWLSILAEGRQRFALIGERIKGTHPIFPNGYVQGTFQFMRRDAINAVGLMDAVNYPLWGASALWQLSICRAGYESLPLSEIPGLWHEERAKGDYGKSIKQLLEREPQRKSLFIRTPPLVSVIIPTYNHGKYLEDAVNSLIGGPTSLGHSHGQTFQSFEVIIVNDGSTDSTEKVGKSLSLGWNGVRYFQQANRGTAAANNTGIRAATGKYITIMAADDMREPGSLERLVQTAQQFPNNFIYDGIRVFADGKRMGAMKLSPYDCETLAQKNMVPAGILYPKEAWVQAGGYPEAFRDGREDWAFNVALARVGWTGLKLAEAGYLYRREGHNRSLRNESRREYFLAKMAQTFPDVYNGSTDMCCGDKRSRKGNMAPRAFSSPTQPSGEFSLLRYIGKNVGNETFGGPGATPTGKYYVFGNNDRDRVKYVAAEDLPWLLQLREGGVNLFVRHAVPATVPTPKALQIDNSEVLNVVAEPEDVPATIEETGTAKTKTFRRKVPARGNVTDA